MDHLMAEKNKNNKKNSQKGQVTLKNIFFNRQAGSDDLLASTISQRTRASANKETDYFIALCFHVKGWILSVKTL